MESADDVIRSYFIKLEELSSLRRQLDLQLKDGFLHMAKARHHVGQNSISSLQYDDRDLSPLVYVDQDSDSLLSVNRTNVKSSNIKTIGDQSKSAVKEQEGEDQELKTRDPLLMFGVLVPQALRSSKTCFQRTIDVAVELSNKQQELVRLSQKCVELRKRD